MPHRRPYVPITRKVSGIIVTALIVGIGAISFYFVTRITTVIDIGTRNNFDQQSEILFSAIESFMIPGEAELAVSFFDDIRDATERYSITLFRTDGTAAFSDFATLEDVLQRRPGLRARFSDSAPRLDVGAAEVTDGFADAIGSPPETVFFEEESGTRAYARSYQPLINLPDCTYCHGADHTIRGVIDIHSDITASRDQRRESVATAGFFYAGLVIVLTAVLSWFMRRTMIGPVRAIARVCADVTNGDFAQHVEPKTNDEIGDLGRTVNTMVEGLRERFQLAKYVSSSTLKSLSDSGSGRRVPLTVLFSDIRGFTSFSEKRSPEQVVRSLNTILNSQTRLIHEMGGDVDKYVGDEIVSMFADEGHALNAVRAAVAVLKDMEEYASAYDDLTVGIGINTGEVILGMVGSEERADFTVIGDDVNVASRLCAAAKPRQILITETTYRDVRDHVECSGPYRLKVKGKDNYLRVYAVDSLKDSAT